MTVKHLGSYFFRVFSAGDAACRLASHSEYVMRGSKPQVHSHGYWSMCHSQSLLWVVASDIAALLLI